jgi:hypothetical protein
MSKAGRDPARVRDSKPAPSAARTGTWSDPRHALLLLISYPARLWLASRVAAHPAQPQTAAIRTLNLGRDQQE